MTLDQCAELLAIAFCLTLADTGDILEFIYSNGISCSHCLKRRILEVYPEQIRYYDACWDARQQKVVGLEGFLAQVEQDLRSVLLRDVEAENQRPWQERTMAAADRWFREESKNTSDVTNGRYGYIGSGAQESWCWAS